MDWAQLAEMVKGQDVGRDVVHHFRPDIPLKADGGDCGVVAFAILVGVSYDAAKDALRQLGWSSKEGVSHNVLAWAINHMLPDSQPVSETTGTLQSFLENDPEFTGFVSLVDVLTGQGHAVAVVHGLPLNVTAAMWLSPVWGFVKV